MALQEAPTFAALLKRYLEESGISLRELARRMAIAETGEHPPPVRRVENIRRNLGRYLAGDTATPDKTTVEMIAAGLGLQDDAFDEALPATTGRRRTPRDQIAEIKELLAEITQAIGDAEGPDAETIRGLLGELAGKVAKVQSAATKTTRALNDLRTRVERLEAQRGSDEAQPKDQAA